MIKIAYGFKTSSLCDLHSRVVDHYEYHYFLINMK